MLEVSGLEVLAERGRQSLFAPTISKFERARLLRFLPGVEGLREEVFLCQQFVLPTKPIGAGETVPYFLGFNPSQQWEQRITINRTLRALNGKAARFDESLPLLPNQPKVDVVTKAVASAIWGKTTVDAATGLPQIDLSIRLHGKILLMDLNGNPYQAPAQEQTHITLSTKLEP